MYDFLRHVMFLLLFLNERDFLHKLDIYSRFIVHLVKERQVQSLILFIQGRLVQLEFGDSQRAFLGPNFPLFEDFVFEGFNQVNILEPVWELAHVAVIWFHFEVAVHQVVELVSDLKHHLILNVQLEKQNEVAVGVLVALFKKGIIAPCILNQLLLMLFVLSELIVQIHHVYLSWRKEVGLR